MRARIVVLIIGMSILFAFFVSSASALTLNGKKFLVTIDAIPSSVMAGESSILKWTVINQIDTGSSSCTASGGWSGSKKKTGGSETVYPTATATYSIKCIIPPGYHLGLNHGTLSESDSVSICVPSWTPPTSSVCSGQTFTQSDGCDNTKDAIGTSDGGIFSPTLDPNDICLGEEQLQSNSCSTQIVIGTNASLCGPVDGVCGSANGTNSSSFTEAEATCDKGTKEDFSGSGPWSWKCAGLNGGNPASCLVNAPIDGACGSDNNRTLASTPSTNACNPGAIINLTGSGPWQWKCSGLFGGVESGQCSAQKQATNIGGGTWREVAP